MKKKVNTFIVGGLGLFIRFMPSIVIAFIVRLAIKKRDSYGKDSVFYRNNTKQYTVLALDSERYRGDIDVLAQQKELRVLHINQGWQVVLVLSTLKGGFSIGEVLDAKLGTKLYSKHQKTHVSHRKILSSLYKILKVDCVTTVHFKYIYDYYWTSESENLNVPFIMLARECNFFSPMIYGVIVEKMKAQSHFHGTHIIVHNKKCKEVYVDNDFCDADKITIASALRMDRFVRQLQSQEVITNHKKIKKNKTFVLFYFPVNSSTFNDVDPSVSLKNNYWDNRHKLFIDLHQSILELASHNRDINFIIKPKSNFMVEKSWRFYQEVIKNSGVNIAELDNYIVNADLDVSKLLIEADVVCGLQSSTTVEAAFAGKRVILPMFDGFRDTPYFGQFPWRNYIDVFDVAHDIYEFKDLVYDSFKNQTIPEGVQQRRKELFLSCFDDLTGQAAKMYTETIIDVIESNQQKAVTC